MPNYNPAQMVRALADKAVENIYNLAYVTRAFQDASIPLSKLAGLQAALDAKADAPTYTEYVATISQNGTNAPTATVLSNTLTVPITWSYTAVGIYRFGSTAFSLTKTIVVIGTGSALQVVYQAYVNNPFGEVFVKSYTGGALSDSVLNNTPFMVRVYP